MTDKHKVTLEHQVKQARAVKRLTAERDRLRSAIRWALGETDHFSFREDGHGAYWWRTELRKRAGMDKP